MLILGYGPGVAELRPFAALRYDEERAGPLESLVAPPYDVLSEHERQAYLEKSPYNVVHLTLPDSEEQAASDFAAWREQGVLREETPSFWALEQDYVGPDGIARTRRGIVASLKAEPYARGVVLPHERTHREAREGRLRLVRAVGAQLEPIFLLYEGLPPVSQPEGEPELEVEGAKLWRLPETDTIVEAFKDRQLMIADGHHRYETTVENAKSGGSPWMMVVLVSTSDPGLEIFPTHRLFRGRPEIEVGGALHASVDEALAALAREPYERAAAVAYRGGVATLVHGAEGSLDVELVDAFGHEGIAYTADLGEAIASVDRDDADIAFLLRATRIEDVFERARRGDVMPQKTTYFFPKLTSGLLFHPA